MKKRKLKKKPLIFIGIILILGIVGATFAYYYSQEVLVRKFKTMTYGVEIREEFDGDFGTKKVSFVNNDEKNVPVLLRISYNESWTKIVEDDESGEVYELHQDNETSDGSIVQKDWTDEFLDNFETPETDYDTDSDGWYYYNKILAPGESVQILERIIEPIHESTKDYKDYEYHLTFNMEAIQATDDAVRSIWNLEPQLSPSGDVDWGFRTGDVG